MKEDITNYSAEKAAQDEKTEAPEMSEEDKQLKDELEMLVQTLDEGDSEVRMASLESLKTLIRASTTSMTSVPKPLKFLRPHYEALRAIYEKLQDPVVKMECANVVSVVAMVSNSDLECLKFHLLGKKEDIGSWGHEYVRQLTGEIIQEFSQEEEIADYRQEQLLDLARVIIPYHLKHNAEVEGCDLAIDIEHLELLEQNVEEDVFPKVVLYLLRCVPFVAEPEDSNLLRVVMNLNRKFNRYPDALIAAMKLNDKALIEEIFHSCPDTAVQKQMAFMLARQQVNFELNSDSEIFEELESILSNSHLNENFMALARELDIMEPKTPEGIYKTHLDAPRPNIGLAAPANDSDLNKLASSFVSGFVNAGFGKDKLITENNNEFIFKNKDHRMMSVTAALGQVNLWDVESGIANISKLFYSTDEFVKAGALLGCGVLNSGIRNSCDPVLALLSEEVLSENLAMRVSAVLGLGLAYAGSDREDVLDVLIPVLSDPKSNMEVIGITALACGLVSVGSCNLKVTASVLEIILEKSEDELQNTFFRFLPLGLGLCYLGKQENVEMITLTLAALSEPFRSISMTLVDICAYAGTRNVLKIQSLLQICGMHHEEEENKAKTFNLSSQQGIAALGIALLTMGEDIGVEMAFRQYGDLLRYGDPAVRRAVPLALGLLSVSNPRTNYLENLSKFSHDADKVVAQNSIFAMGLVGSGTNNARLAAQLRQLAVFHHDDPQTLFMVRIAQGLAHLGKGTMTLNPYHSDRELLSPVAIAGLLACLVSFLDVTNTVLDKSHYLLFTLVPAIQPRLLVTLSEDDLRPIPVHVRVGEAVDVVGQAGNPKSITGFQTHTTPVLLAQGERAELATDEYIALAPVLEGFVILRKNPDYEE